MKKAAGQKICDEGNGRVNTKVTESDERLEKWRKDSSLAAGIYELVYCHINYMWTSLHNRPLFLLLFESINYRGSVTIRCKFSS